MALTCRICPNSENNKIHRAREMMFGTREEFDYLECGECGTLQILEIPVLDRHYPSDYYSYELNPEFNIPKSFKNLSKIFATRLYLFFRRGFFGKLFDGKNQTGANLSRSPIKKFLRDHALYSRVMGFGYGAESVFRLNADVDSRILDYGCGNGKLLNILNRFGYRNLTGADTFIESDISYPNGVKILKRSLEELEPSFDLIMLHHSFEHLPDPLNALREIRRLLSPDGLGLIRMPVASFAWKKYGVNWVSLDPPRHLFVFTEKSFRLLAEKAGFVVESVIYDSEGFQFWGSEQYLQDIPLKDSRSFTENENLFTKKQLKEWKKQARELNAQGQGDRACFYLRPV
jgi:SAM-dependent methyltransferase